MNIGVAYEDGQIAKNLGGCRTFLVVTTEGQNPTGKHLAQAEGDSTTALLKLASMEKLDVLICGALGLAIRNALEMIGVLHVPGCDGSKRSRSSSSARSRATRPCSRSAARRTRTTRWPACTTAPSARAAARSRCSVRSRSKRSSNKRKTAQKAPRKGCFFRDSAH